MTILNDSTSFTLSIIQYHRYRLHYEKSDRKTRRPPKRKIRRPREVQDMGIQSQGASVSFPFLTILVVCVANGPVTVCRAKSKYCNVDVPIHCMIV